MDELFNTSAKLLDVRDYNTLPVEELCQKTCLPPHEFFGRFGSKDGYLCEVLKYSWQRARVALWNGLNDTSTPAIDRLYGLLDKLDTIASAQNNDLALLCRQVLGQKAQEYCALSESARLVLMPFYEDLMKDLRTVCEDALQHAGILPAADARQLAALIYSAVHRAFSAGGLEYATQFHAITNHARSLIRIHHQAHHRQASAS